MVLLLFGVFAMFSLMAVGGANALLPEIHRYVVESHGWMSGAEFAALFAIAQAAPGPNVLVVSLIGWKVAGVPGALASTVGMCAPSSVLCFYVAKLWEAFKGSHWRRIIERALAPITIGLVLGSGWLLSGSANHSIMAWVLCFCAALVAWKTKLNPLFLLALGALVGGLGWM